MRGRRYLRMTKPYLKQTEVGLLLWRDTGDLIADLKASLKDVEDYGGEIVCLSTKEVRALLKMLDEGKPDNATK